MDITPLQAVIAAAAFVILAVSLFYKLMRDLSKDLKAEMQQTRNELGRQIDDTRTEMRQTRNELIQKIDDTRNELIQKIDAARAEAREDNKDLRASVEVQLQGTELDRAKAQAAYELLRGSAITVPTAPPDEDDG